MLGNSSKLAKPATESNSDSAIESCEKISRLRVGCWRIHPKDRNRLELVNRIGDGLKVLGVKDGRYGMALSLRCWVKLEHKMLVGG